jgi:hypothetical protein
MEEIVTTPYPEKQMPLCEIPALGIAFEAQFNVELRAGSGQHYAVIGFSNELFEQLGQVLEEKVEALLIGGAVMPKLGLKRMPQWRRSPSWKASCAPPGFRIVGTGTDTPAMSAFTTWLCLRIWGVTFLRESFCRHITS